MSLDRPSNTPRNSNEAGSEEVKQKFTAEGKIWYTSTDGAVRILDDAGEAELTRQQLEPATPPAPGYPRFAQMTAFEEIPGAPSAAAGVVHTADSGRTPPTRVRSSRAGGRENARGERPEGRRENPRVREMFAVFDAIYRKGSKNRNAIARAVLAATAERTEVDRESFVQEMRERSRAGEVFPPIGQVEGIINHSRHPERYEHLERGRDRERPRDDREGGRSERRSSTLEDAQGTIEEMIEDGDSLADALKEGAKDLPNKDLRRLVRWMRKHDDIDETELNDAIASNKRLSREIGGKKEGAEGRSEAQSGGSVLEGIDQRMTEREARIKKLLEG